MAPSSRPPHVSSTSSCADWIARSSSGGRAPVMATLSAHHTPPGKSGTRRMSSYMFNTTTTTHFPSPMDAPAPGHNLSSDQGLASDDPKEIYRHAVLIRRFLARADQLE